MLDLDPAARAAWLDELRAREHGALDRAGFLAGGAAPHAAAKSLEGQVVGAYTLRAPLGQGGMGQVWLAERSDGRFEGRAAKFVRRNRGGVAAAALVALAALAGTLGIAWQAREARRQRDAAEAQLARATAANDFTAYLLGVAAPTGRRFTVGELRALVSRRARPSRPGGRAARPWSARRGASRVPSRAAAP